MHHHQIFPDNVAAPAANYAHARLTVDATRWLHTSGVVPIGPQGSVPPSLTSQAEVIWTNILAMLRDAHMTPADVVSVTTYVTPGHDLAEVVAIRDRALEGHRAASTLVVVAEMARPE
ncbi:MAG: RidA family protein [Actinomycetia bacterium]|nr:RidA family protein [Actinomycetes bacterium]